MNRKAAAYGTVLMLVGAASGLGLQTAKSDPVFIARENAATERIQARQQAELQARATLQARQDAKKCAAVAQYWTKHGRTFDTAFDACMADPAGAQRDMAQDQNARQLAEYQHQQELYNQQQAEYRKALEKYEASKTTTTREAAASSGTNPQK